MIISLDLVSTFAGLRPCPKKHGVLIPWLLWLKNSAQYPNYYAENCWNFCHGAVNTEIGGVGIIQIGSLDA